MKHTNAFTKYFSCITFLLAIFLLSIVTASAQSRDPEHPTPISGIPLSGRFTAGTYYFAVPVNAGPGTMGLQVTAPVGGASVSVALSGPDCCTAEAYVGVSTGREETIRGGADPFTVPSAQTLLVTINISVAAGDTAGFLLNIRVGGGSGVIITPPASPTPTPSPTPGRGVTPLPAAVLCTDLSVESFAVNGEPGLSREIVGVVRNLTTTHPYKGFPRLQWIEVLDITDSVTAPRLVSRIPFWLVGPGATFSYSATHTLTVRRRTRYEVQIRYSPYNATDRSQYNDDCNSANNSTRRQLLGVFTVEREPIPKH